MRARDPRAVDIVTEDANLSLGNPEIEAIAEANRHDVFFCVHADHSNKHGLQISTFMLENCFRAPSFILSMPRDACQCQIMCQ